MMTNLKRIPSLRALPNAQDEKKIIIPNDQNDILIQVKDQTWVAIYRGDQMIVCEQAPVKLVRFQLPPGEYMVRTDGRINDVTIETVARPVYPDPLHLTAITAKTSNLRDLPPDIVRRLLSFPEVKEQLGLDQETVNHIMESGTLPEHVRQPPDSLNHYLHLMNPALHSALEFESGVDSLSAVLNVLVEAPIHSQVDNIAEVPADGESFCTLNLSKKTVAGQVLERVEDDDEIYLRTTGGRLVDTDGKPLRKVKLEKGKASFRLVSESVPRFVTVSIVSPTIPKVDVQVDFVLVDEG